MRKFCLFIALFVFMSCSFLFTVNEKQFYENYEKYHTFEIELDGALLKFCAFKTNQQYENWFRHSLKEEYNVVSNIRMLTQFRQFLSLDEKLKQKMRRGEYEYILTIYNNRLEVYRRIENAFYIGDY